MNQSIPSSVCSNPQYSDGFAFAFIRHLNLCLYHLFLCFLSTLSTFTFTAIYQLLCSCIQRQRFAFPRVSLHPCTFTGPNPIPPWFALDGMFPKALRFGNGNHMNGMDGVKGHGRNVSIFVAFPIGFGGFGFLGNGGTQIGTGQIQLSGTESI